MMHRLRDTASQYLDGLLTEQEFHWKLIDILFKDELPKADISALASHLSKIE